MARMSMVEAIRDAMDCKMAEDERVVVFGEEECKASRAARRIDELELISI